MPIEETLFDLVRAEVLKVATHDVTSESIVPESLLTELGVDSMRFVELTVALETMLQVEEFPMQAWVDDCMARDEPLTVQALVAACAQVRGVVETANL